MHASCPCALPAAPLQAQERGEQTQVLDDAVYALDGMSPGCSVSTQRDSCTALAELLSTRRGRLALRWASAGLGCQGERACTCRLTPHVQQHRLHFLLQTLATSRKLHSRLPFTPAPLLPPARAPPLSGPTA